MIASKPILTAFMTMTLLCYSVDGVAESPCMNVTPHEKVNGLTLSAPKGFVEICAKDKALCHKLTAGYPPSTKTIGYLVLETEWQKFKSKSIIGFSRYLIAQLATGTPASDFGKLKDYIREKQGKIPDNTKLPSVISMKGEANLGVISEDETSITFGHVMKFQKGKSDIEPTVMGTTNIPIVIGKDIVLSLYVYDVLNAKFDIAPLKILSSDWITCLRQANPK